MHTSGYWRIASILALGAGAGLPAHAADDDYVFVDSFESSDCSAALACSGTAAGKSCIAGQLRDIATLQPLRARFNVGLACGQGAIGGPCDLAVGAYDALAYSSNPNAATPLPASDVVVDGCGRFRFSNLQVPASPFAVVAVDDVPPATDHMATATVRAVAANQNITGVEAPVATSTTVVLWSALGAVDFTGGALLLTFSTAATPTGGVMPIRDGGAPGSTVRYFTDADAQRILVSTVATSTGANGSALIASAALGNWSGTGGETNGCLWPTVVATSIAGVIVFAQLACTL